MNEISYPLITRLKVKNYRSLADIDIALTPLTVFVGKNSTGKSNVIDVLRFVRDALSDGFECAVRCRGGFSELHCWFTDLSLDISIQVEFKGPEWSGQYAFAFGQESPRGALVSIKSEHLTINETEVFSYKSRSNKSFYLSQMANQPHVTAVRNFLAKMNFYDLLPSYLRKPQAVKKPFPLAETGENLASALREMQKIRRDYLITEALEVVVEGIDGYQIYQEGDQLVTKWHYTFTNGTSQEAVSALSNEADGTIRLLSILTALYQNRSPSPLAIETPEKDIYSRELAVCSDVLQEAAYRYQVLVTTHSPDLINELPVDLFLVVEKENGLTKIGPIIEYQREVLAKNSSPLEN